ncbi:hypothetical protein F4808DRAFT_126193 [Astrocystis sublimbata]|nr:hypothetical protein F4808DRAFT_126193 [Astrocystis sublimbata]
MGGTAVVGGSTVSLVTITMRTIITVDGTTATLFPRTTRQKPDFNDWNALGLVSPSSKQETTSHTSKPTTTGGGSTPPPPPETNAPPGARPVWMLAGQIISGSGPFPVQRFTFNCANLDDFDPESRMLDPCDLNSKWQIEAPGGLDDLDTKGLEDLTDVFGDTCSFVSVVDGRDWVNVEYGETLGSLQNCKKWSDATCVKYALRTGNTKNCGGGV